MNVVCPECKGRGTIITKVNEEYGILAPEEITCSICNGYGVVNNGYRYRELNNLCTCEIPDTHDGESDGAGGTIWYCMNCHKRVNRE